MTKKNIVICCSRPPKQS